jgi:hypothetical protein
MVSIKLGNLLGPAGAEGPEGPGGPEGPEGRPGINAIPAADFIAAELVREGGPAKQILDEEIAAGIAASGGGILGQLFALLMFVCGHSYVDGNGAATPNARWFDRFAANQHMGAITNAGISGHTVGDVAMAILGGALKWTARTRAHVQLCCMINDLTVHGNSAPALRGFVHATRFLLSRFTADAIIAANTPTFVYTGSWAEVSVPVISSPGTTPAGAAAGSTGGVWQRTTTVGDYVDVAVTGDAADVVLIARKVGAGLVTATVGGTTVGALNLTSGTAQDCPAVLRLTGLGSGTHIVRLTLTSGASMTVDSVHMVSTTPVIGAVIAEGDLATGVGALGPLAGSASIDLPASSGTYLDAMDQFRALQQDVVDEFPSFAWVDIQASPLWTGTPDLFYDGKHPNDKGSAIMARLVEAALRVFGYSAGMNVLAPAAGAYVPVSAPLQYGSKNGAGAGGPVVTKLTNDSARVDWSQFSPPAGTTSYTIQYRVGTGSWTDVASAGLGTSKDLTGLPSNQMLEAKVAPVVGSTVGTYSLSTVRYIGTISDDFNRTDLNSLGVTSVGGESYTIRDPSATSAKWGTNGTDAMSTGGTNSTFSIVTWDARQSDYRFRSLMTQVVGGGLVARFVNDRNYIYSQGTALYLRAGSGSSGTGAGTLISAAGTVGAIANNDVMEIECIGTTIVLYRNGVECARATGVTAGLTSTLFGLMGSYHATETSRTKFNWWLPVAA